MHSVSSSSNSILNLLSRSASTAYSATLGAVARWATSWFSNLTGASSNYSILNLLSRSASTAYNATLGAVARWALSWFPKSAPAPSQLALNQPVVPGASAAIDPALSHPVSTRPESPRISAQPAPGASAAIDPALSHPVSTHPESPRISAQPAPGASAAIDPALSHPVSTHPESPRISAQPAPGASAAIDPALSHPVSTHPESSQILAQPVSTQPAANYETLSQPVSTPPESPQISAKSMPTFLLRENPKFSMDQMLNASVANTPALVELVELVKAAQPQPIREDQLLTVSVGALGQRQENPADEFVFVNYYQYHNLLDARVYDGFLSEPLIENRPTYQFFIPNIKDESLDGSAVLSIPDNIPYALWLNWILSEKNMESLKKQNFTLESIQNLANEQFYCDFIRNYESDSFNINKTKIDYMQIKNDALGINPEKTRPMYCLTQILGEAFVKERPDEVLILAALFSQNTTLTANEILLRYEKIAFVSATAKNEYTVTFNQAGALNFRSKTTGLGYIFNPDDIENRKSKNMTVVISIEIARHDPAPRLLFSWKVD